MPFKGKTWSDDEKQDQFMLSLADRLAEMGFEVEKKTPYHYRINKRLDIFPVNRLWHDIKKNERGHHRDMLAFVPSFFRKNP